MTNEQLVARIKAGEDVAENMLALWQQNEGFIVKMANKYKEYGEIKELLQEGYLGLSEAVRHYEADMGVLFISYAGFWIKQTMMRYIDNCGSVLRLSVNAREKIRSLAKVSREYREKFNREAKDWELQRLLGVNEEQLVQIKKNACIGEVASLSAPIGDEDGLTLGETISSGENFEDDVLRRLDHENMARELWNAVEELPADQATYVRMRYKEQRDISEIESELGVSFNAARHIRDKALRALRNPKRAKGYKDYFECYVAAGPIYHVGVESFRRTWTSSVERQLRL